MKSRRRRWQHKRVTIDPAIIAAWNAPHYRPDAKRVLRVSNEYFTAGAIWERKSGWPWRCIKTAPILAWMKGMTPDQAKLELLRKGCSFQWLESNNRYPQRPVGSHSWPPGQDQTKLDKPPNSAAQATCMAQPIGSALDPATVGQLT